MSAEPTTASGKRRRTLSKLGLYLYYRILRARRDAGDIVFLCHSEFFDPEYYLHHNPDVALSGLDPVIHYVDYGAGEERNPSPFFETSYYLANNPDVVKSGVNPLLHFLRHGGGEGRRPSKRYGVDPKRPEDVKELVSRYETPDERPAPRRGRIVVYTALVGAYDVLRPPEFRPPNCDFVVFSDRPMAIEGWRVLPLNYAHADPVRAARFVKLHPHLYFSDYDYSIWLDANIGVRGDVTRFTDRLTPELFIGLFIHPLRDCIYIEGEQCIAQMKDGSATIRWQLNRYQVDGFPREAGLWETGVLVCRHNDRRCIELMETWWREIEIGSRRDQISLPVVAQRLAAKVAALDHAGINARVHPLLTFAAHAVAPSTIAAGGSFVVARSDAGAKDKSITIGVCVHNALDATRNCLQSVAATRRDNDRVIIIDDGSDGPTAGYLKEFCDGRPGVDLVRHGESLGYTRSANEVFRNSVSDWTVLLNADTVVPPHALRNLIDAGEQYPRLGVVGPLSNAAGWQTVPALDDANREFSVNELPEAMTVEQMQQICERVGGGPVPFVPLVNGFCFAVRRALVDEIGLLDETAFPLGYGEEDDFCFRAADAGYVCGIATDAYIFHVKSASFTTERRKVLAEQGARALRRKHSAERVGAAIATMRGNPRLAEMRALVAKAQADFAAPRAGAATSG